MSDYLVKIDIDINKVNEIYKNFGNTEIGLNTGNVNLKIGDTVHFYIDSDSVFDCMNNRIAYTGKVTDVSDYGNIVFNLKPILTFAADLLTKENLPDADIISTYPAVFPIDLKNHAELKKYIQAILSKAEFEFDKQSQVYCSEPVPYLYEEQILVDYYNLVRIYETQDSDDNASVNKINGSVASSVILKYIDAIIRKHNLPYTVSEPNVFILGSNVEIDALILKKGAKSIMGSGIYNPGDVVSLLEFKSNGIYSDTNNPFENFISVCKQFKNEHISAGYITVSEYMPVHAKSINYYSATKKHFAELMQLPELNFKMFCVKRRRGKKNEIFYNGYTWESFVLSLLP